LNGFCLIENYPGDVRRKLDLDQRKSTIAFDKTIPDGLHELATGKIFYETFTPKSRTMVIWRGACCKTIIKISA
jgi:hypothetical protein